MRERVDLKSPVREYRSPGSVRGAPGNRRPYLDGHRFVHRNPTLIWVRSSPLTVTPPALATLPGPKKIFSVR